MGGDLTLARRRDSLRAVREALTGLAEVLWQASSDQLGPLFTDIDDVARLVEAARVAVLTEAVDRGDTAATLSHSRVGWVLEWAPSLQAGGAGALVAVVDATRERRCEALRAAVLEGRVSVRSAVVCLSEMSRLGRRLLPEAVPTVWEGIVQLAEHGGPRDIRALRPRLLATYGAPGELQADEERAKRLVALTQPYDDGDGLHEYRLRLDVEGKAVLEAALGPLSAPRPGTGVADLRSSDQRRGDALVEICRRAVGAGDAVPVTSKAQLFLTMDYHQLARNIGAASTTGSSDAGTLLAPATVRRIACDASVLPVVLGGAGQVLDCGRERRLFTTAQVKTMWLRDRGCTMHGCTMPAQWCDAHHLTHWLDGGPTDLANAALLCGYHHHLVHHRRLAGHLGPHGSVTWDLTRGSYDQHLTRRPGQQ
ncbi:MAG: DUF222 domain-containing protein [Lapillicoccus sp.]